MEENDKGGSAKVGLMKQMMVPSYPSQGKGKLFPPKLKDAHNFETNVAVKLKM